MAETQWLVSIDWEERCRAAEKELDGALQTIAALVGTAGGEVRIPSEEIRRAILMKDTVIRVDDEDHKPDLVFRLVRGKD
jgi:hypothetical protein